KTLKEMKDDYVGEYHHNGEIKKRHKYRIPNNEAVEYPEKELLIEPYALGALIGDASLTSRSIPFSSDEPDVVNKVAKRLKLDSPVRDDEGYRWHFGTSNGGRIEIANKIEELGLNVTSTNKFIPKEYLLSSEEQRMELLKGLMDTDGRVFLSPKKSLSY